MSQDSYKLYIEGEAHLTAIIAGLLLAMRKREPKKILQYSENIKKCIKKCVELYIGRIRRLQELKPNLIFSEMEDNTISKMKKDCEKSIKEKQKRFPESYNLTQLYNLDNLIEILKRRSNKYEEYVAAFYPELLWAIINDTPIIGTGDPHLNRLQENVMYLMIDEPSFKHLFDNLTEQRSRKMAERVLEEIKQSKAKLSYLIVGKDHIQYLPNYLKEEAQQQNMHIDYVVYSI